MPLISFASLPLTARVWVFAADRPVTGAAAERLLGTVDQYLATWAAHAQPLLAARDWRDDQFLAIGLDQSAAHASGCSIDGLFRVLQTAGPQAGGASLVSGGLVHYRDQHGAVQAISRGDFGELATQGAVSASTPVFDATVESVAAWRDGFETQAGKSWHAALL